MIEDQFRKIVENARVALGARMVVLSRYEPKKGDVFVEAVSFPGSSAIPGARASVKARFPGFDATRLVSKADANSHTSVIYLEGKPVSVPLKELAQGVVHPGVAHLASAVGGMRFAHVCPVTDGSRVIGALSFFCHEEFTASQQYACHAFASEISLSMENTRLHQELRVSKCQTDGGLLLAGAASPKVDGPSNIEPASQAAVQITGAISDSQLNAEQTRAEEAVRLRSYELEVRYSIAGLLAQPNRLSAKYHQILEEIIRVTESEWATLRMFDDEVGGLRLLGAAGPGPWDSRLIQASSQAISALAFNQGFSAVANDYADHPGANPAAVAQGAKSVMSTPITIGSEAIGAITVVSRNKGHYTNERTSLLAAITEDLGLLLDRARLREQRQAAEEAARERTSQLAALYDISSIVSQPGAFVQKAERVLAILADLSGAEWATLRVPRKDDPGLHLIAAAGPGVETSPPIPVFGEEQQLAMSTFMDGEIRVVNDYAAEQHPPPAVLAMGTRSVVMIPMRAGERTRGLVTVISRKLHHFTPEIVRLLTSVGDGLGIHLEKARMDEAQELADDQIRASLAEKEVLLREINHRVKNNLQIISSLLNLQSRGIQDEMALRSFEVSQERIRAMALIHEKFYQSDDLARIDFGDYIRSLAADMGNFYGLGQRHIEVKIDAEEILLGVDTAIPCGLIVNELVSNSLKHAFQGREQGEISIRLRTEESRHTMVVKDNGVGFPPDLDITQVDSLGLTIVKALADQMGGQVSLFSKNGAKTEVNFPAN